MADSSFLSVFSLCFLLTLSSSPTFTISTTITIPLTPFAATPSSDLWQKLNHLTAVSLARAHQLKHQEKNSAPPIKTPLFPQSYGGYSISLSFGSPPQTLSFLMDTGSNLVWFPCTSRYTCSKCNFPNFDPSKIPTFIPKLSSSARIVGCKNPKCGWVSGADVKSRCPECDSQSSNCSQSCPPYLIQYGLGDTGGLLLLETLNFPEKIVKDFIVGCSIFSSRQPAGIAGFGRSLDSLPSQMGVKKFSYCLLSHRFDDIPVSSSLVLETESDSGADKVSGISYTPFRKNPVGLSSVFSVYYYVTLRKITVGDKTVKVPYRFLVPGSDGNGGTIVDSGSTFTYMGRSIHEPVAKEFEKQMANYSSSRAMDVEKRTGLGPCYEISGQKSVQFPELTFQFKGGAKMVLPLANYFSLVGRSGVVCMTVVTDDTAIGVEVATGPAIVLGNYQQQDFYIEYDLENSRFGFRKQTCK